MLVNRFVFPGIRVHSESMYYLDNRETLELLVEHQRLPEVHSQMEEELRMNREADYAGASAGGQHISWDFSGTHQ